MTWRRLLLSTLGAAAMALAFGSTAKPMMLTFDARTGGLLHTQTITSSMVNEDALQYLRHISDLNSVGIRNYTVENNGQGGVIQIMAYW